MAELLYAHANFIGYNNNDEQPAREGEKRRKDEQPRSEGEERKKRICECKKIE